MRQGVQEGERVVVTAGGQAGRSRSVSSRRVCVLLIEGFRSRRLGPHALATASRTKALCGTAANSYFQHVTGIIGRAGGAVTQLQESGAVFIAEGRWINSKTGGFVLRTQDPKPNQEPRADLKTQRLSPTPAYHNMVVYSPQVKPLRQNKG